MAPNVEATPAAPETARTSRYLRIAAARPKDYSDGVLGARKLVEAYQHLWMPHVGLSFVVAWHERQLRVGYAATSDDPTAATSLLRHLGRAVSATNPWLTLDPVCEDVPWQPPQRAVVAFGTERVVGAQIVTMANLAWRRLSDYDGTWHLVIDLVAPGEPQPAVSTHNGDADLHGDEFGTSAAGSGVDPIGTITLYGDPDDPDVDLLAALLAADTPSQARLRRLPLSDAGQARSLDLDVLAHLLAIPTRADGLLPPVAGAAGFLDDAIAEAAAGHILTVGASGQGKSTSLVALGAKAAETGAAIVAVDVHDGAMARDLYARLREAGRPVLFADCSPQDTDCGPTMRLFRVPPGMTPAQHAERLKLHLRHDCWGEMPDEYFGPVGMDALEVVCLIGASDPLESFGPSDVARLYDPADTAFRAEVLARIGDPRLTRRMMSGQLPMVTSREPGNSFAFLTAKFSALASASVRAVLEGRERDVPVEEALARGCSVVVYAPAGLLGDEGAAIIAGQFISRVWHAVRRMPQPPYVVALLDEAQKYATTQLAHMLAEGRKYGLRGIFSHQHFAQLPTTVREALLANVGAIAAFRVGPADAVILSGMYPTLTAHALQTLPRHTIAVTSFEHDRIVKGAPPVPADDVTVPPWIEQLTAFWDGPEPLPALPSSVAPAMAESEEPEELWLDAITARQRRLAGRGR